MKYLFSILSIHFIAVLLSSSFAQVGNYSKIKIHTHSTSLETLSGLGLAIDHGERKHGHHIITDLSSNEIKILQKNGIDFEIIIEDVQDFYQARNSSNFKKKKLANNCNPSSENYLTPSNFSLGSMGGYFTYNEFLAHLDTMYAKFPNLISQKQPIDTFLTHDGYPLYWLRISDSPNTNEAEPEVLYTALHHAREPGSLSQLIFYMYYLLENYGTDSSVTNLVNNTEMYFVPMINPDGYIYNETTNPSGGGMWRKNRRNNGGGSFGVDLNRNYGYLWAYDDNGSSPDPNSQTYRGPVAFSEPETQAIKYLSVSNDFKIALNYHSYGNLFIYPWGYDYSIFTPDSAIFAEYAKIMTQKNNYTYGTGDQTVGYIVNGDSDDWMYGEQATKGKTFACTPEVGESSGGFWPAQSEIIPLCKDNMWQNITMARLAGKYAIAKDNSADYVYSKNGYFPFTIQRLGLDSPATYTVTLTPVGSGITSIGNPSSFTNLSLMEKRTDSILYSLDPNIQDGQSFEFAISVDNGSFVINDTITKVYGQLTEIFSDNFDNTNNWSFWPSWGLSNSVYYSPASSITESPGGNYQNNTTYTLDLSSTIDLTGDMLAKLSFYGRWEIEPGYDYAQMLVSSDAGSNWTPICGKHTKPGSGNQDQGQPVFDGFQTNWVLEEMDLSEYAGQIINVRFLLESDNWTREDGFYLDDLSISSIPNSLQFSITSTNASCGNNDGEATVVTTGGVPPYTYLWNDPNTQTNAIATGLAVGTYNISVSDQLGYSLVDSIEIANSGAAVITITEQNASCFGEADGSANITLSGGTVPFTYAWSNGETSQNISNLLAGSYSVTVTDSQSCTSFASVNIMQPTEISLNSTVVDDTGGMGTGSIVLAITSGTPPFTYAWSNGEITASINQLIAGSYTVTITDSINCSVVHTVSVGNTTGLLVQNLLEQIKIYPNPNDGSFTIYPEPSFEGEISITDIAGRKIFHISSSEINDQRAPIKIKNSGVYIVVIKSSIGFSVSKRVIVY